MYRGVLEERNGIRIIGLDTITDVHEEDAGNLVIAASHGGVSSGSYAVKYPLLAAFFNDAGLGKDAAGIAALWARTPPASRPCPLQEVGAAGGTYSHNTARIGDVQDAWENGVISHINEAAAQKGVREGEPLRDALRRIAEGSPSPTAQT